MSTTGTSKRIVLKRRASALARPDHPSESLATIHLPTGESDDLIRLLSTAGYDIVEETATELDVRYAPDPQVRNHSGIAPSPHTAPPISRLAVVDESTLVRDKMDAVARLLEGLAHDFNNILSVVAICADEAFDPTSPEVREEWLADTQEAIERGSVLTRDLLAFSQRENRGLRLVDLHELVRHARPLMRHVLGEDITLRLELKARHTSVRVHEGRWMSVFVSLAMNARRVLGDDELIISTADIDTHERGRCVELAVSDSRGQSALVVSRVLEPFFSTLVDRDGPPLDVVPDPSGFRIVIPVVEDEIDRRASMVASPAALGTQLARTRVLFVEDEETLQRIGRRALERAGFLVHTAQSAEEAIGLVDQGRVDEVDVLVADVDLPGLSGPSLADHLRRRYPDLRVLFTSALGPRADVEVLEKPYTTAILLTQIQDLLGR